jgi:acyl carrier protein
MNIRLRYETLSDKERVTMAIEKSETTEKVISIIAEKLSIAPSAIQPQATLSDLGADSLDMVEIVMKIEEQFDIEINDEDAEKLHNVQDVIDYVYALRMK